MNCVRKYLLIMVMLAVTLTPAFTAQAQDSALAIENMPNVFGVGVAFIPDYQGSDDYTVGAGPTGRYTFSGQERYIQLIVTEISANVLDHPVLRFGPVVNYRFGRDDGVEDDIVKKMKEIEGTIEAGLFGGVTFINSENPRKRFITSVEFLHDVGGEHEGYTVSLRARYWYPVSRAIDVTLGAGVTYADDDYMSTYFDVTPGDSAGTGLPIFEAGGGIKDIVILPAAVVHFSEAWHVGIGARYQLLLDDAENSPVVDVRGSADQLVAGMAVAYSW